MTAEQHPGQFIRKYSELLLNVWRDEDELRKLLANPTQYASDLGFELEPGAVVAVEDADLTDMPTRSEVDAKWSGTPGQHTLVVPKEPLIDLSELSDAELDSVAAGMADNNNNIILIILL